MFKPETIEKIDYIRRQKRFARFMNSSENPKKEHPDREEFLENMSEAIAIEFNLSISEVNKMKSFLKIMSTYSG